MSVKQGLLYRQKKIDMKINIPEVLKYILTNAEQQTNFK